MALVAGFEAPHGDRGLAWMLLAIIPFLIGWRWRLPDLRLQAYGLAVIGPIGMAVSWPEPRFSWPESMSGSKTPSMRWSGI